MKISKRYRPEVLVSKGREPNPLITDPFLDVAEERLVATNGRALVALPVDTEKGERSRYLACNLLEAARSFGEEEIPAEIDDQEVKEYGVLWPTAQERTFIDWKKLVPKFTRGSKGTVSFALDPDLLAKVARAMGVGGVVLTIELGRPEERPSPVVVQPFGENCEELGLLMPLDMDGGAEPQLADGQICPVCRRILAAGAPCPEHGHTSPTILERGGTGVAPTKDGITTITLRTAGGREVTATQDQMRAALTELERRKDGGLAGVTARLGMKGLLTWHHEDDGRVLGVAADGLVYQVKPHHDGFAWFQGGKRRGESRPKAADAEKDAERAEAERQADALLPKEMKAKSLKGDAAAFKPRKGGR